MAACRSPRPAPARARRSPTSFQRFSAASASSSSTGTKNLQEQIVQKDLPVLAEALDKPFTATVMKGRGNYLCLHRFQALRTGGLPRQQRLGGFGGRGNEVDERILLPILDAWASRTETGDRAELDELPEDLPLWSDISAVGRELPRHRVPRSIGECFAHAHAATRGRIRPRDRRITTLLCR